MENNNQIPAPNVQGQPSPSPVPPNQLSQTTPIQPNPNLQPSYSSQQSVGSAPSDNNMSPTAPIKKNNSKIIWIIVSIILVLVIVGVIVAVILLGQKSNNTPGQNNDEFSISDKNDGYDDYNDYDDDYDYDYGDYDAADYKISCSKPSIGAITTAQTPVKIGEWALFSRKVEYGYDGEPDTWCEIPVRITSIIRGDEAKIIAERWDAEDEDYILNELDDKLEYAIINYEIDLSSLIFSGNKYSSGVNRSVDAEVVGLDGDTLTYDNILFYLDFVDAAHSADEVKNNKTYESKIIGSLPKNATEYLIKIESDYHGSDDSGTHHDAYFRGQ